MRRAHLSETAPGYQYQAGSQAVEEDSNQLQNELLDKVKGLKSLTIEIGTEVRDQNRMLAGMDDDFEKSGGFLKSTMSRVQTMARAGHNRYIFYLLAFSFFVFIVIWLIVKFR